MTVLTIKHANKTVHNGAHDQQKILTDLNLRVEAGDFITVLGGNGAGKSTLFNSISGTLTLDTGSVAILDHDLTKQSEEKRAKYIARVFQDPKLGTAPRMTVAENLTLAQKRGQKRGFHLRKLTEQRETFKELCASIGNGLEKHLDTPTGNLSGGQRQALSLLMTTLTKPELLLLDEHTAALDPKTAKQLMQVTNQKITEDKLTCLMITHKMEDALTYGNRLLVMKKGQIVKDFDTAQKAKLTLNELFHFFEETEIDEAVI